MRITKEITCISNQTPELGTRWTRWQKWIFQNEKNNSTEKNRYLHKIIMLLPKKLLSAQFMKFQGTVVVLWIRDRLFLPRGVLNVRCTNILCTQSQAPAPKLGHRHLLVSWQGRAHAMEIYLACLRGGLAVGVQLWPLRQMSNAKDLSWVQQATCGTGGGDVAMRPLPPSTCVWWQPRPAEQSCCVGLDGDGTGNGSGDKGCCLPPANNFLQSTDKIMALSQKL